MRLKGTMILELTDESSGAVETVTEEIMVTNAVNNIFGLNPMEIFYTEADTTHTRPQCGKPVAQKEGRKEKKFCSDKCRTSWWNSHQSEINRKAYYTLVCQYCGKEFKSNGNQRRKFCCRECYANHRKKLAREVCSG